MTTHDDADPRRERLDKARRFEERVAELFRLLGYKSIVDYQRDRQFDIRLEKKGLDAGVGTPELVVQLGHAGPGTRTAGGWRRARRTAP